MLLIGKVVCWSIDPHASSLKLLIGCQWNLSRAGFFCMLQCPDQFWGPSYPVGTRVISSTPPYICLMWYLVKHQQGLHILHQELSFCLYWSTIGLTPSLLYMTIKSDYLFYCKEDMLNVHSKLEYIFCMKTRIHLPVTPFFSYIFWLIVNPTFSINKTMHGRHLLKISDSIWFSSLYSLNYSCHFIYWMQNMLYVIALNELIILFCINYL